MAKKSGTAKRIGQHAISIAYSPRLFVTKGELGAKKSPARHGLSTLIFWGGENGSIVGSNSREFGAREDAKGRDARQSEGAARGTTRPPNGATVGQTLLCYGLIAHACAACLALSRRDPAAVRACQGRGAFDPGQEC